MYRRQQVLYLEQQGFARRCEHAVNYQNDHVRTKNMLWVQTLPAVDSFALQECPVKHMTEGAMT